MKCVVTLELFLVALSLLSSDVTSGRDSGQSSNELFTVCHDGQELCVSLPDVSSLLMHVKSAMSNSSNAEIRISSSFVLLEVLNFVNLSLAFLSLRGDSTETVISCDMAGVYQEDRGLVFDGIENISLTDITIRGCGVFMNGGPEFSDNYSSAVFITHCIHVSVRNIVVENSKGSGLSLWDNSGTVNIARSTFKGSYVPEKIPSGNGLFLLLRDLDGSHILIEDCTFRNNTAVSNEVDDYNLTVVALGVGGGASMSIRGRSQRNTIVVMDCLIEGNNASWGGGMYIDYRGEVRDNSILVCQTNITDNVCPNGGGGVDLGYIIQSVGAFSSRNTVTFTDTNFLRNSAGLYGGGTGIFGIRMTYSDTNVSSHITFENCLWEGNSAFAGSAVDISPQKDQILEIGLFPIPLFVNSTFRSNYLRPLPESGQSGQSGDRASVKTVGVGAVLVTGFSIRFKETTLFMNNSGTALFLSSGIAELLEGSWTTFRNNSGRKGGGIFLSTFSLIRISDGCSVELFDNVARLQGGAIYSNFLDPHTYGSRRNCFIQYNGNFTRSERNINVVFENNSALSESGHDIYASTILSCSCSDGTPRVEDTLKCIGNIRGNISLMTSTDKFIWSGNSSNLSEIIPGSDDYHLPIVAYDEFHQQKNSVVYEVVCDEHCKLSPSSRFVLSTLEFIGPVNTNSTLMLESGSSTISIEIGSVLTCPPGYTHDNNSGTCVCASENIFGVSFCNQEGAYIYNGFWIGMCPSSDADVCSSHCPLGFCHYDDEKRSIHLLPKMVFDLDYFVCGPKRTGSICGFCRGNRSTFYHSYRYQCGNSDHCKYGWLLYIVSELLPLTIMFFLIIILDISFTSGWINGFIFFAQVLDSISIDANGVIFFPQGALRFFTATHRFIYRTLNFDFFSLERLSFCLWQGATALDVMVMKYATVVYAIILVMLLVVFMNTWKCKRLLSCWRQRSIRSSAKHGLIAFIVICYSQCARVSFQILSPTILYGYNYEQVDRVAFRMGEYKSFGLPHLKYAIPALLVLIVMSLVPFFLILYPLIFRLLALCKLSESKAANVLSRVIPIPLLDAFQSSFKDDYRFFSGLYFLYRLFALAAYAYSATLIIFYSLVELQLVIILGLHAVVQPYKVRWHNVIDSLIFTNLALINGFTLYNYNILIGTNNKEKTLKGTLSVQAILVYLPLVYVVLYLLVLLFRKVKLYFLKKSHSQESSFDDSVVLPPLRHETADYNCVEKEGKKELLANYTYGY